ncbi:MAG: citrate/2-methylcitrate synthase [Candidatus Micrarchaeia archaeon]
MAKTVHSSVDWADLEKGRLYVRDMPLERMVREHDFIDALYHTWLHKKPSPQQKRMLNAVLVCFAGGWSIIPPVTFAARLAATTKAPIAQCIAAAYCASGPSHTSAIEGVMAIYRDVELKDMESFVHSRLEKGGQIPGFGHPVVARDPRPVVMRKLCDELGMVGPAVRKFDVIESTLNGKKGIYGNVDGINGAILNDLGFVEPSYGPALFLLGRSLSITAHILEEYKNKPFEALKLVYPGFHQIDYGYDVSEGDGK